jgi:hypothetical protein
VNKQEYITQRDNLADRIEFHSHKVVKNEGKFKKLHHTYQKELLDEYGLSLGCNLVVTPQFLQTEVVENANISGLIFYKQKIYTHATKMILVRVNDFEKETVDVAIPQHQSIPVTIPIEMAAMMRVKNGQ